MLEISSLYPSSKGFWELCLKCGICFGTLSRSHNAKSRGFPCLRPCTYDMVDPLLLRKGMSYLMDIGDTDTRNIQNSTVSWRKVMPHVSGYWLWLWHYTTRIYIAWGQLDFAGRHAVEACARFLDLYGSAPRVWYQWLVADEEIKLHRSNIFCLRYTLIHRGAPSLLRIYNKFSIVTPVVYFQYELSVLDMIFLNLYSDAVEMDVYTLIFWNKLMLWTADKTNESLNKWSGVEQIYPLIGNMDVWPCQWIFNHSYGYLSIDWKYHL